MVLEATPSFKHTQQESPDSQKAQASGSANSYIDPLVKTLSAKKFSSCRS